MVHGVLQVDPSFVEHAHSNLDVGESGVGAVVIRRDGQHALEDVHGFGQLAFGEEGLGFIDELLGVDQAVDVGVFNLGLGDGPPLHNFGRKPKVGLLRFARQDHHGGCDRQGGGALRNTSGHFFI